jgi:hypothetical protein
MEAHYDWKHDFVICFNITGAGIMLRIDTKIKILTNDNYHI